MSYLLDALKQSQQNQAPGAFNPAEAALHYQQQAELARYKRLVYLLGGTLAMVLTVGGGFMAGKWTQQQTMLVQAPASEALQTLQPKADTSLAGKAQPDTPVATAEPVAQGAQLQSMQVVQTPTGGQAVQWVPVQPVYQMMVPGAAQPQALFQIQPQFQPKIQPQSQQTQPDLSGYKVLGKPLGSQGTVADKGLEREDNVLSGVSPELRSAFANAVAATEDQQDYEVTHGTVNSAEARPLELMPDVLQSQIPAFRYQAHIYATDPTRRWIKLNDYELYEGDEYAGMLVEEIAPEQIVLNMHGNRFSVRAMQDWGY